MPAASATSHGPVRAADALFRSLYVELHRLARREVRRRGSIGGVGATTLLHEAYLSLAGRDGATFVDHARFMAYAARVMRGLIVDDVRRRLAEKRGGQVHITAMATRHLGHAADMELTHIGDALDALATVDPALAEVVELKFFCGFSFAEIAAMRGVSERTVQRAWEKGRLFLRHAIAGQGEPPTDGCADG